MEMETDTSKVAEVSPSRDELSEWLESENVRRKGLPPLMTPWQLKEKDPAAFNAAVCSTILCFIIIVAQNVPMGVAQVAPEVKVPQPAGVETGSGGILNGAVAEHNGKPVEMVQDGDGKHQQDEIRVEPDVPIIIHVGEGTPGVTTLNVWDPENDEETGAEIRVYESHVSRDEMSWELLDGNRYHADGCSFELGRECYAMCDPLKRPSYEETSSYWIAEIRPSLKRERLDFVKGLKVMLVPMCADLLGEGPVGSHGQDNPVIQIPYQYRSAALVNGTMSGLRVFGWTKKGVDLFGTVGGREYIEGLEMEMLKTKAKRLVLLILRSVFAIDSIEWIRRRIVPPGVLGTIFTSVAVTAMHENLETMLIFTVVAVLLAMFRRIRAQA